MMGAGLFPAGFGPAGYDVILPPSPPIVASAPPAALYYDPSTRQFLKNPDGSQATVHPVDQQVALALTIELGAIPSVPGQGADFRKRLNRADPRKRVSIVNDVVNAALATLIGNHDITLVSVDLDTGPNAGRASIAVTYTNLRLAQTNQNGLPQTPTLYVAL